MKSRFLNGVLAILIHSSAMAASSGSPLTIPQFEKRPKLVLVIVIDQFRADYLTRFQQRFLPAQSGQGEPGGFRYMMSKGAFFPAAHYDVLQSMTCPGHAMILSGSYPYANGIMLNEWYDAKLGRIVNCVEDPESPVVAGTASPHDKKSDKKDTGYSPKNFVGSTFGDELKNAGFPSQVVSIALKDRAAIYLGGMRADLAMWLANDGQWVSSRHYLKDGKLPAWITPVNEDLRKRMGQPYVWKALGKPTGFSIAKKSDGKDIFPLQLDPKDKESLGSPFGLEITTNAAIAALKSLKLGQGAKTDLLSVSFSSHDLIGHHVGPNALEMEEMTVNEDREIARLLNAVRKDLPGGLKDVAIVLTADHGMAPIVSMLNEAGVPAARMNQQKLADQGEEALIQRFGKPAVGKWIAAFKSFNFYLNPENLNQKKVLSADAETVLKSVLMKDVGTAHVLTRSEYRDGNLPPEMFGRQIRKSYVPTRSGDVILIPKPFYMDDANEATHMTGYSYDRTVPLLFAGPHIRAGVYSSETDIVDIAPTLSFLAGVLPPAQSEGRVLSEMIGD